MSSRKKLIAGNWKMNKTSSDGVSLVAELVASIGKQSDVEVVVCPPFTALESAAKTIDGSTLKLGAQNMHFEASGAFTGEVSGAMLKDVVCSYVLVGHSERRQYHQESDATVALKAQRALAAGAQQAEDVHERPHLGVVNELQVAHLLLLAAQHGHERVLGHDHCVFACRHGKRYRQEHAGLEAEIGVVERAVQAGGARGRFVIDMSA